MIIEIHDEDIFDTDGKFDFNEPDGMWKAGRAAERAGRPFFGSPTDNTAVFSTETQQQVYNYDAVSRYPNSPSVTTAPGYKRVYSNPTAHADAVWSRIEKDAQRVENFVFRRPSGWEFG